MREFALVRPTFWIGRTGRWLRTQPPLTTNVALYLITCPSSEMSGLYYIQIETIAHALGASSEDIRDTLQSLQDEGFLLYDSEHEVVFVINMARFQIGDYLHPSDNRVKGLKTILKQMVGCPFFDDFMEEYGEAYHLEDLISSKPLKPLKPLHPLSKDKEKDKDKEKEKEKKETRVRRACVFPPVLSTARFGESWSQWLHFRKETKHPLTSSTEEKQLKKLAEWGEAQAIASIEQSIEHGWQGLFEPKTNGKPRQKECFRDRGILRGTPEQEAEEAKLISQVLGGPPDEEEGFGWPDE